MVRRPTIVTTYESVAVVPPFDTVYILLGLLERNVHISVYGLQLAYAVHTKS